MLKMLKNPNSRLKKKVFSIVFICITLLSGCRGEKETHFSGRTMGTFWNVKIVSPYSKNVSFLKNTIEQRLKAVNQSMSLFIKNSEINRFNSLKTLEKIHASADFFTVMSSAEKIYNITNGAWDGTIEPLVNLWGFGKNRAKNKIPQKQEINQALAKTGFNHIKIFKNGYIKKNKPFITVDLASIAKGYAADAIAELLKKHGIKNFIVEIGGEVFADGTKRNAKPWIIGISSPLKNKNDIYTAIKLKDRAAATSGDYRNFFEINGKAYSHIINPKTGSPVQNNIAGVTVTADSCAVADGLATAVMVMGRKKGIELTESLDNVECLIFERSNNENFETYCSEGFIKKGQN